MPPQPPAPVETPDPYVTELHEPQGDARTPTHRPPTLAERFARRFGAADLDQSGADDPGNDDDGNAVYEVEPAEPFPAHYEDAPPAMPYTPAPVKRRERPLSVDAGTTRRISIPAAQIAGRTRGGAQIVPGAPNGTRVLVVNSGTVAVDIFAGPAVDGAEHGGPGGFRLAVGSQPLELNGFYRVWATVPVAASPAGDGQVDVLQELDPHTQA